MLCYFPVYYFQHFFRAKPHQSRQGLIRSDDDALCDSGELAAVTRRPDVHGQAQLKAVSGLHARGSAMSGLPRPCT